MRFGIAIDLHAPASVAGEVAWPVVRDQVRLAEQLGFDLVVLPDHLAYRAGGQGDYVRADEAVGARESMTIAAALAAITDRITIAHSVVNAPYRSPTMVAHLATTIADIAGGRYSLGIGVGNTFDYDQLGVADDWRVSRFEECLTIVHGLLRRGTADLDGRYWAANDAQLALRSPEVAVPLVVAAGGERTLRLAARFGDAWNGYAPTDPEGEHLGRLVAGLEAACHQEDRDPSGLRRTVDMSADPLDVMDARARSLATLRSLERFDVDEVRIYAVSDDTPAGRTAAIHAARDLVAEV